MRRVLLYLDDYSELVYMETLFKKLGFDAQGVQTQRAFEDALLGLNPEVCIMTARGKRVHGLDIAENISHHKGHAKIVLFAPRGLAEKLDAKSVPFVDAWVETPPSIPTLLTTLAAATGMEAKILLEKYNKIRANLKDVQGYQPAPDANVIDGGADNADEDDLQVGGAYPVSSTMTDLDRKERYKSALSNLEKPTVNGFARDKVEHWTKVIRREEREDLLRDLEAERSSFVKALFKMAKKPFNKA